VSWRDLMCGEPRPEHVGQELTLAGWASRRRDHGGLVFVDLRDRSGITQLVLNPERSPQAAALAGEIRNEFVLQARGELVARSPETVNDKMPTGAVELAVDELTIVSRSTPLPFQLDEENVDETLRLRYRWLDLRREKLQRNLRLRAQMVGIIRRHMEAAGFLDIQTPILYKSTPEGARDFVVPSRLHKGTFFALPQSPQILKQLTMIGGFDRYYQIAICFRDEDLRADRVQELTQLDVEMSFPDREVLFASMEEMFATIWRECLDVEIPTPWPRLTFAEVDRRFGTDKPDLRFGLELEDATEATRGSEFGVFANAEAVRFLRVPRTFSRAELATLEELAKERGAKGLAYLIRDESGELRSPVAKFLSEAELAALAPGAGETLLFAADDWDVTSRVLGHLRLRLGAELGLIDESAYPSDGRVARPVPRGAGRGAHQRLRHHRQRQRARRRLLPDPRARAAGQRVRAARDDRGGAARQVRVPARRARDGRPAARRDRARDRSHDDGAGRRAEPPRRDRVPEEPGGARPDVRRADEDHGRAVARARAEGGRRGAAVSARVAQRLLALGAVAMLAGLIAVAVVERREPEPVQATRGAVAAGGGWYEALAAPRPVGTDAERTSCGLVLTARSLGVTHPVLPCGAKVLVRYGGDTVLTEVIDNELVSTGRQFELTPELARLVGLDGTQEVEWRYATRQ
jgi:aspartyl-tRNA synthetase